MTVANHNADDIVGIEPNIFHLLAQIPPAARGVPVKYVLQLLPAAVVKRDLAIPPFDDAYIRGKVEECNVMFGVRTARDKGPVRHE